MEDLDEFNTLAFEKKLTQLKDTQESIQSLSSWCLKQRNNHKKIVSSWLNVLKRVKVEQRLTLFYLANDVIQYSKRKNYEFVSSWGCYLQKAVPLVRDEKVRTKILRIFKIWEQRSVYDEEFLSDLTGLLSAGATKKTADDDSNDFQPQQLVNKIRQCTSLENDTDICLKYIHESHLELSDADALCASLKDKRNTDDVEKDLNEGIMCVEKYTQALQKEILARGALILLLKTATQYYSTQRGEVKVVALAYKTFGQRVKQLKRKLDELTPKLPSAAPSPPQRDEDVPSPGPDEDFDLPNHTEDENEVSYNIDKTFSTSLTADGALYNVGLSSFLGTDMGINIFNESANNQGSHEHVASSSIKPQDALPGLDLLTPESTGSINRPVSFYGAIDSSNEETDTYRPEITNLWNTTPSWDMQTLTAPVTTNSMPPTIPISIPSLPVTIPSLPVTMPANLPVSMPALSGPLSNSLQGLVPKPVPMPVLYNPDTPESPASPVQIPHTRLPHTMFAQDHPPRDIDQRGILPPPPPPPMLPSLSPLFSDVEDIDHRMLHSLPVPPVPDIPQGTSAKDVDHRNLISLTQPPHLPAPIRGIDQDYRVPPPMGPNDIVESVDMDLSEDEELHNLYQKQPSQPEHMFDGPNYNSTNEHRRNSFIQNNKVLVGGDNHTVTVPNARPLNRTKSETLLDVPKTDLPPPPIVPLKNPFDNSIPKNCNFTEDPKNFQEIDETMRVISDGDYLPSPRKPFMGNPRFQRNWNPAMRGNFRPPGFHFRPRGSRPNNRWMGGPPRPRFW